MRILLVEDDALLGDGVRQGLKLEGYAVDWLRDGAQADAALQSQSYELLLLDIGLPRLSGLELLKALRARGQNLPVLILTARDAVADRVQGLDAGADDYLVKPFDLDELAARVRALLRRPTAQAGSQLVYQDLVLDPATRAVTCAGQPVSLSAREYQLLYTLLSKAGRVLAREQLESALYGWDEEVESNAVEVHIHHLRKKLGTELIRTVRGAGYVIDKV